MILWLYHNLHNLALTHLMPMRKTLLNSLKKRFAGVFACVRMPYECTTKDIPYSNDLYSIAAFLDPSFKLYWIDADALVEEDTKTLVKTALKGWLFILCYY